MSKDTTKSIPTHGTESTPATGASAAAGPGDAGTASSGSIFKDLDALRLRQDFNTMVDVRRQLTSVRVGKPGKQVYFRTLTEES